MTRVSYTVAALPPDSFDGRGQLRAVQVEGIAGPVTDPAELQRAIQVSRHRWPWLTDMSMMDTLDRVASQHQAFFRIDPVEALRNDNWVCQPWRKIVTFTPDSRHVAALAP